ncbi:MAG: molecular chaperone DnaK [Myxococcales bacterium]|nr:molecular chaperone DnaK [Myxococcales bacterium]MDD9965136.1 molecular chaperone DnaK [Myxococcales bacterium]
MGCMIGIDLGTTNCCMAVLREGVPTVIPGRQGHRTMPSVVAFADEGPEMVGLIAQRQAVTNPHRTIYGVKRLIGRKFDDEALQRFQAMVPYDVVAADNGDAWVQTRDDKYSPQEVSALLLREIKHCAEEFLGEPVTEAIVTVPAYFNDNQRQATKDAGKIAGLDIRHIINEPTAAALGYSTERGTDQCLAVFDLGGGTFDITLLRATDGVFEVLASNGDTFLGGNDFDQCLFEHLAKTFQDEHGHDLRDDPVAVQRLKEAAEAAKQELSTTETTAVNLPFLAAGTSGPLHLKIDALRRETLEELAAPLLSRLEAPCRRALDDAGISVGDLDQVLLVGGMTRMPAVQRKVEELFGEITARDSNPDEIVATGAAYQSGIMSGQLQDVVLLDVTPHSLGVKVKDDRMSVVIERNTTIPTSENKLFATTRPGQDYVDIEVYQGEHADADRNTYLGRFTLEDLPAKAAGKVTVLVTFMLDADGVLHVTAKETETGNNASVRIEPSSGLSQEKVGELVLYHAS